MTNLSTIASLVDLGRRLDALDVRLTAELKRLRQRRSDCSSETRKDTGATHNFRVHSSDQGAGSILQRLSEGTPTTQLSLINRNIGEDS